jgi:hypothetical protein
MNPQTNFALIAFLLAGCAIGPESRPPKANVPANWSEVQFGGATDEEIAAWTGEHVKKASRVEILA